ncbi:hypothetical protein [Dongia sedimenti]|uniref:Uncharacterized protein n=1 Tax=Dongia sedimenti TaxID=3064282 RepID=A0ABU0YK70_9PROT|nr:hypothetical protein [Rhodospirillaceae bacterium R-7]
MVTPAALQPMSDSLLGRIMAQALQIDPAVFEQAPTLCSAAETVAAVPNPVAVVQPSAEPSPVWYRTPVAVIPIAAAAFIIGNVLMMVPWSVF